MKKFFISAILVLSSSVSANAYKSEFVDVSIQIQEGKESFRLVCQPKVPVGELPKNWVSSCNDIGKKLLELAVDKGMKVALIDKVFGMAGDFAQKASSELPKNIVPKQIVSREFGG
ncbi:hypothetical protein [uncultured Shewanella sp.]|uniref:hypothetical protein n=1 Tax=uncultured Shewanella sp. TaxID=173975 RepID=UPI00262E84D2|nr:hypothetical protein [uncultured Shewanella sp.]